VHEQLRLSWQQSSLCRSQSWIEVFKLQQIFRPTMSVTYSMQSLLPHTRCSDFLSVINAEQRIWETTVLHFLCSDNQCFRGYPILMHQQQTSENFKKNHYLQRLSHVDSYSVYRNGLWSL